MEEESHRQTAGCKIKCESPVGSPTGDFFAIVKKSIIFYRESIDFLLLYRYVYSDYKKREEVL